MRHVLLFGIATGILLSPSQAQITPEMQALQKARGQTSKPVLTERYGADDLRRGELRLPAGKGPFPVAVLIHGGCYLRAIGGDQSGFAPFADMLAKRGIASWNIDYRALGDTGAGWPGTFQDVAAGVDHLKNLARRYPLDLRRGAIVGHSAGAHFALWAASRPKLGGTWAKVAWKPTVVAAIDGPATLAPFIGADKEECGQPVIVPLMGGTPAERPAEYRLAQPLDNLPLGIKILSVPAYFSFAQKPFEAAAKAKGDQVLSFTPAKAGHFNIITPGDPAGEAVADWLAANLFTPKRAATRR
jgi:acetyl esterase/lipase